MDAETARQELVVAKYQVINLEGAIDSALDNLRRAEAAHNDNSQYRRFRKRHGDDFVAQFQAIFDQVKKDYAEAKRKLEKAESTYKAITGRDPDYI